jgi:hypothetical protein
VVSIDIVLLFKMGGYTYIHVCMYVCIVLEAQKIDKTFLKTNVTKVSNSYTCVDPVITLVGLA